MRSRRSRNGTYFRIDAVIRFLASRAEGHRYTASGVAFGLDDARDPGCTKHQAKRAIEFAIAEGYAERAPQTIGRAVTYRATAKGRRYAR